MHVGVFTLRDMRLAGGGLIRVVGLTRHLQEMDVRATLFAPNFPAELEGRAGFMPVGGTTGGIDQFDRISMWYGAFPRILRPLECWPRDREFAEAINASGVDLVHCHTHSAGLRLLRLRRRIRVPLALDVHGIIRIQGRAHRSLLRPRAVFNGWKTLRMEGNLFRMVDALVVRTEAEKRYIVNAYGVEPERIHAIPDGADTGLPSGPLGPDEAAVFRQELGVDRKRIILFGGGFKIQSGIMDLVAAYQSLRPRMPEAGLVLIVDAPEELRGRIAEVWGVEGPRGITVLGRMGREAFRRAQRAADVLVAPEIKTLYNELGVPLKLLDCLASGRATLATRIASHEPIVEDGVNGFLVEPENAGDMAAGLERALRHPELESIGARGRETVVAQYTWEMSTRKAIEVYGRIIRGHGAGAGERV